MKNILVIGGTSDIAKDFILNLSEDFQVIMTYREKEKFTHYVKKNNLKNVTGLFLDLSDLDAIETFDYIKLNPFESIVFFAGIDIIKPFKLISKQNILDSFNINIVSSILILKNLFRFKLLKNSASVVFLSSISGYSIGPKGHSLYSVTKSAINGLVMSLSNEFSKKKIRFNSIASGLVATKNLHEKNNRIMSNTEKNIYADKYPLGIGEVDDIVSLINFLISNESKWLTGQTIVIDGGFSIN